MDPFDSQGTVKGVKYILANLGANSRTEATRIAVKHGLFSPSHLPRLE
jgi:DNA-binding NarL/FixJ family response regulator